MYSRFLGLLFLLTLLGCKYSKKHVSTVSLVFLDEYVFPPMQQFENTKIGGLSGVDYANELYYMVSDDDENPRVYTADIQISDKKIDTIIFKDVFTLAQEKHSFFKENTLDLESIIVKDNSMIISSEGSITKGKNPSVFQTDLSGDFILSFDLPDVFLIGKDQQPKHNGVFEGLSKSFDGKGLWSAIELPLNADGEAPSFSSSKFPVRFTYYDFTTKEAKKEFVYELSSLPRKEKEGFNINGLTDILEYIKQS